MENYKFCFVIQPISDEKCNKRFDDVYKPVIEKAGKFNPEMTEVFSM